jgi:hypothetical protein
VSAALRNYVSGRRLNLGNYVSADKHDDKQAMPVILLHDLRHIHATL